MKDGTKTDPLLGQQVNAQLLKLGIETPRGNNINIPDPKVIAGLFRGIMRELNLDLTNDSLKETPERVAKMFVNELFWGLDYNNFPKVMVVKNSMNYDSLVVERNISVMSCCEHHWVPIIGKAHVAYIPNGKVLGLSKLNRVVEFFSRRPQVQERLIEQIYHSLAFILQTENIAVTIKAEHLCVRCRGIEDHESDTVTTKLGGVFYTDTDARTEYYRAISL